MKSDETPVFYRDHVVCHLLTPYSVQIDKFIRVAMKIGDKETSKKHVYAALEIIKRRQYKAWVQASEDEKVAIYESS